MSEIVNTPLGKLQFEVMDENDRPLTNEYSIVKLPMKPDLPPGMVVDEVTAVMLTLTPNIELRNFTFSCSWVDQPAEPGSPESGESLDAQSWRAGGHLVLVGTEDFEALSRRLRTCAFIEKDYPIKYRPYGLLIKIPRVAPGTSASFHFIVASNRFPEPKDRSAWFAVEIQHTLVEKMAASVRDADKSSG